jgi:hypothetical protein
MTSEQALLIVLVSAVVAVATVYALVHYNVNVE